MSHSHAQPEPATADEGRIYGLIAEFDDVTQVTLAARKVRDAGFKRWDVHSPFPIHGIDPAIGIKPTILPWIVLICGLTGLVLGLLLTNYTMATQIPTPSPWGEVLGYRFPISGKPFFSEPAFIPVVFELTILLAAFGGVFGLFLLNRLPMLSHPLLSHPSFKRVTDDRFFIAIEARDEKFEPGETRKLLESLGPLKVEEVAEL